MWFYRWHKAVKQEQCSRLQSSKHKKFQSPEIIWTHIIYSNILLAHNTALSVYLLFQEVFHLPQFRIFSFINDHDYHNIKWSAKNRKSDLFAHLMQINHLHYFVLNSLSCFHFLLFTYVNKAADLKCQHHYQIVQIQTTFWVTLQALSTTQTLFWCNSLQRKSIGAPVT